MSTADTILSSNDLPTLPSVTAELLRLSRDPNCEMAEFLSVLRTDAAICGRILKAVNSPMYGFQNPIDSIEQAIPRLGVSSVTSLALSCALVNTSGGDATIREHHQSLWEQSLVQAVAADAVGKRMKWKCGTDLFLLGLLLDVGRLAMLNTIPGEYLAVLEARDKSDRSLRQVEQDMLGCDHAEIGYQLIESWGLPKTISKSIQLHHDPEGFDSSLDQGILQPFQAAIVASCVGECLMSSTPADSLPQLYAAAKDILHLENAGLDEFVGEIRQRVDVAGRVLSIDTKAVPDTTELMLQANRQLAEIALQQHAAAQQISRRTQQLKEQNVALRKEKTNLERQAMRDSLTGAYNRHYFDDRLEKEIARCLRSQQQVGVIFVDVDKFKSVNDTYGHQCGDYVLKNVAQLIQEQIRACDVLTRFGGEEFIVLSFDVEEEGVNIVAERIRGAVEASYFSYENRHIPLTVCVGASIGTPEMDDTDFGQRLVNDADEAMYECKRAGRNRTCVRALNRDSAAGSPNKPSLREHL